MNKECIKCNEVKPITEFHKYKDTIRSRCKLCRSIEAKKYYLSPTVKEMKRQTKIKEKSSNGFRFLLNRKRSDSKVLNVPFDLTEEYLRQIWTGVCPVFNIELIPLDTVITRNRPINSAQLDRVDPSRGYTIGNVRFISFRANRLKDNGTLEEFKSIVRYLEEVTK